MSDIPVGLCQCGCGQKTNIAPKTDSRRNWKKGHPVYYIIGHHNKGKTGEKHPAFRNKVVSRCRQTRINKKALLVHRVIVEKIIGFPLPKKAVIHHIDGNPFNNSNDNLVVCENQAYHMLLHKRQRNFMKGGK